MKFSYAAAGQLEAVDESSMAPIDYIGKAGYIITSNVQNEMRSKTEEDMKRGILLLLLAALVALQFGCASSGLSRAAIDGDLVQAQRLVGKGESVNEIDKWGWTPLMWSAYYGNFPVTKYLLDNGADPDIKSEQEYGNYKPGVTALILAAAYGHDDAVKALLEKNADPNVTDRTGKRAIDYAEQYEFHKVVALLKKY